jgi:hypothetical protein
VRSAHPSADLAIEERVWVRRVRRQIRQIASEVCGSKLYARATVDVVTERLDPTRAGSLCPKRLNDYAARVRARLTSNIELYKLNLERMR